MNSNKVRKAISVVGIVFGIWCIIGSIELSSIGPGVKLCEEAKSSEILDQIPDDEKGMTEHFLDMVDSTFGDTPKPFFILTTFFGILGFLLDCLLIWGFWSLLCTIPRYRLLYATLTLSIVSSITRLITASMYEEFLSGILSSGAMFQIILWGIFITVLTRFETNANAFEAIRHVLADRKVNLPKQNLPTDVQHKQDVGEKLNQQMGESDTVGDNIDKRTTMKMGWYCAWRSVLVSIPVGIVGLLILEFTTGALLMLVLMKAPNLVVRFITNSEELELLLSNLSYSRVLEQMRGGIFDNISQLNTLVSFFITGTMVFNWFGKRTIIKYFSLSPSKCTCKSIFVLVIIAVIAVYLVVGLPLGYLAILLNLGPWVLVPWLIFVAVIFVYTTGYIIKRMVKGLL